MAMITRRSTPVTLVDHLRSGMLFTTLVTQLAGEAAWVDIYARSTGTSLSADESRQLFVPPAQAGSRPATGSRRVGLVRAGRATAARITAVYLPDRIPDEKVRRKLTETALPLGQAVVSMGGRREQLDVAETIGTVVLESTARLWVPCPCGCGERPVALVSECLLASFLTSRLFTD
jgi:hypothetical protein